jgi:hypothetical protein
MDTRLRVADSSDDLISPLLPQFAKRDKPAEASHQMEAETTPRRDYRILQLRESFRDFDPGHKGPRLEIDAAVDKYHLLDGLNEPWDPQNTPASNSERQGTPEPSKHHTENLTTSPVAQTEKPNFDCFQDSPENRSLGKPRPSKLRRLSGNEKRPFNDSAIELGDQPPASNVDSLGKPHQCTPSYLDSNYGGWFKAPTKGLWYSRPTLNTSTFETSSNTGSGVRCVRFSTPSIPPSPSPPRAMCRPMPSTERNLDDIALYRRKKYGKWRITRPKRHIPNSSPRKGFYPSVPRIPAGTDVRLSSLSSLPSREMKQTPFLALSDQHKDAVEIAAENIAEIPITHDSNNSQSIEQGNHFVKVSFSLYRLQEALRSSPRRTQKYALEFRTIETEIKSLPGKIFPQFPPESKQTTGPAVVDDLLFHACFIFNSRAVQLPLAAFSTATGLLTENQVGAVIIYLARALLSLMAHLVDILFSMCGVSFSCRWYPSTGHSD